jgi:hypothetical protein
MSNPLGPLGPPGPGEGSGPNGPIKFALFAVVAKEEELTTEPVPRDNPTRGPMRQRNRGGPFTAQRAAR